MASHAVRASHRSHDSRPLRGLDAVVGAVDRLQSRSARDLHPHRFEDCLERVQHQHHVFALRRFAHQPDSPHFALEGAEPGTDFDVEYFQQFGAHGSVVDAVGNLDGGELRQAMALLSSKIEAHRFESGVQSHGVRAMALEARVESLFNDDPERFVNRIVHRDRRGMMIDAVGTTVALDHREVEVPRTAFALALAHGLHGALAERHRRESGRRADSLLRATEAGVDSPLIDLDGNASERRHRVHHHQRAVPMRHRAEFLDRLKGPGRGFSVNDGEPLGLYDASPFGFDFVHSCAEPPGRVREPIAKRANRPDYDVVAFFDQVDQRSFHPRRPGPGHGKSDFIGGLEDETEQLLDVVHHAHEGGVEMADYRREHRLHYAWMNTGWTRPQKDARRRLQLWKRDRHYRVSVYAFSLTIDA